MIRTWGPIALLLGLCALPLALREPTVPAAGEGLVAAPPALHVSSVGLADDGAGVLPRFLRPQLDAGGCKPGAPIEVDLQQVGVADGSVVELAFALTPHVALGPLHWRIELPDGAVLLEGAADGIDDGQGAPGASHRVRVRLPADADGSRVSVVVDARLVETPGIDADERVQSRRSLRWGEASPVVATRRLIDVERGLSQRVAELPARHRAGR
jgi:hypothetical protein